MSRFWNIDTDTGYSMTTETGITSRMVWASGLVASGHDATIEAQFFDIPVRIILIEGFYPGWDTRGILSCGPVAMTREDVPNFLKMLNIEYGGKWSRHKVRFFLSNHRGDGGITSIVPTEANRFLWYYRGEGPIVVSGFNYENKIPMHFLRTFINAFGDPRCLNIIINPMFIGRTDYTAFATGDDWVGCVITKFVTWQSVDPANGNHQIVFNSGLFSTGAVVHEIIHECGVFDDYIHLMFGSGFYYYRHHSPYDYNSPLYTGMLSPMYGWMVEHSLNNVVRQKTCRDGFGVKQSTGCNPLYSASGEVTIVRLSPFTEITWDRVTTNKLGYIIFPNDYEIYSKNSMEATWVLQDTIEAEASPGIFPSSYSYTARVSHAHWKVIPRTTDAEWSWKASGTDVHWWNYLPYTFDYRFSYGQTVSGIYSFDYR